MDEPPGRFLAFFRELKRRNVYRVAVTYAVVAFFTLQAAKLIFPATTLEGLYDTLVVVAFVGFPIALVLAWAFEMTPEGVRRTPEAEAPAGEEDTAEPAEERRSRSRLAVQALVGLGLVGAAVAGGWYLMGGGGSTVSDRSIAVLPFEALGRETPGPFTEGMHDDLLARLSNVSDFEVISRTTVQRYRDTDLTTAEIAEELGVRWVLEGGVQEMGDQIQVNAQLIDPRSDTHIWAEQYRRALTTADLFDIQSEITERIARSLEARLSPAERERVERRPTEDLEAYQLYVRGRTHLDRRTEEGMRSGAEYFRRALERDSTYALAWTGLADARSLLASYGYAPPDSLFPQAQEAAERALALDSTLAEAHASRSLLTNGVDAVKALQRAVELKPSYGQAHHWLGINLAAVGRLEEAIASTERAAELDPLSPAIGFLALAYYWAERPEEALGAARRAGEVAPEVAIVDLWESVVLSDLGRQREARAALEAGLERMPERSPFASLFRAWPAVIEVRAGDTARARQVLGTLDQEREDAFARGIALTALGEEDEALAAFREADIADRSAWAGWFRYGPVLEPLRSRSAYRDILQEVNVGLGLNPDGSLPDSVEVSFESLADE